MRSSVKVVGDGPASDSGVFVSQYVGMGGLHKIQVPNIAQPVPLFSRGKCSLPHTMASFQRENGKTLAHDAGPPAILVMTDRRRMRYHRAWNVLMRLFEWCRGGAVHYIPRLASLARGLVR